MSNNCRDALAYQFAQSDIWSKERITIKELMMMKERVVRSEDRHSPLSRIVTTISLHN